MARGAFIVLEGLDRSGKSTQVAKLVDRLNQTGHKARLQKFPDRTTAIGKMIDAYLQSQAELDDRAIHLFEAIKRDLANGMTIVADRYAFSGIAFSAAKGLPFTFCLNPDAGLPLPDLTLYLTVPPEVASTRGAYGVERYENLDMQTRTREQFAAVAREVQARHGEDRWVQVSAVGTIDEVEARIWELVDGALRRVDEQESDSPQTHLITEIIRNS
ncbi:Thymidylate kinase [Saitozyma podzolica]|uniref:Thymidylate kinase n=1 Tax=Saitozyma podzolica TaxID=1890683 RepID=A0A427YSR7_9TREE|nr:Thymidylate kinase [Saitozyma podzolica]